MYSRDTKIEIKEPEISIKGVIIDKIKPESLEQKSTREASEKTKITKVLNLISCIERETNLTKRTIFRILEGSNNLNLLFLNPPKYAEKVIEVIKECKKSYEVEGIKYINLEESYDVGLLREEVASYGK